MNTQISILFLVNPVMVAVCSKKYDTTTDTKFRFLIVVMMQGRSSDVGNLGAKTPNEEKEEFLFVESVSSMWC